jgi:hypothetical protein
MIAYESAGSVFALTENAELLLHDGASDAPLWRFTLDSKIVGVGLDTQDVVAVTDTGNVSWFAAKTKGDAKRTAKLGTHVQAACIDVANDRIVALTANGIVRHAGGTTQTIAENAATCIALAPDGATLFATANEVVVLGVDGTRKATATAGVRAAAWHPGAKGWLLGVEAAVLKWDGNNQVTHVTNLPAGSKLDFLAASTWAIAIGWNRNMVAALDWPSRDTLGTLRYLERKVEGIAFGPWPWLGVGLDLGDGNKLNLESIALHRSDTHPGREHHRWMVSVGGKSDDDKPRAAPPRPAPVPPPARTGFPVAGLAIAAAIVIAVVIAMR